MRRCGQIDPPRGNSGQVLRVGEEHPQKRFGAFPGDQLVGFGGLLDGETVADQRGHVQAAGSQQVDHGLQVAPFGPAHETSGIVLPALLVGRVVAPGAVGTRHLEIDLFVVVQRAGDVQTDRANCHDLPTIARQQAGQLNGVVGARVRADQNHIEPPPLGESRRGAFGIGTQHSGGAHLAGQLNALRGEIHPENGAARGPGDAHGQQAEQSQPDDRDALAHLRVSQAKTMQGDGAQGGEGGTFKIDVVWQFDQQVLRNNGVFSVNGKAAARAGHPVAHLETVADLRPPR